VRVFAVLFLMLAAEGRLTWGDIITGIVAVPVLWLLKYGAARYSTAIATWNLFGAADLVLAIAFGITSSEDSPCNFSPARARKRCSTHPGRSFLRCWSRFG